MKNSKGVVFTLTLGLYENVTCVGYTTSNIHYILKPIDIRRKNAFQKLNRIWIYLCFTTKYQGSKVFFYRFFLVNAKGPERGGGGVYPIDIKLSFYITSLNA